MRPDFSSFFGVSFTVLIWQTSPFFVFDKFRYGCLVNPRIMAEYGDCLFLAVIRLADLRPLRPRIVLGTLIRCFRHHLKLCYRFRPQTDGCSDTVITGVAASDDNNVFALGIDVGMILKLGIQKTLRYGSQEIDSKVDALCISSLCLDIPWI